MFPGADQLSHFFVGYQRNRKTSCIEIPMGGAAIVNGRGLCNKKLLRRILRLPNLMDTQDLRYFQRQFLPKCHVAFMVHVDCT